ncbi:PTS sugar transporter subunit IIA, partial [Klebsiella pneumoniae]|uniref:PTS sugar transporter subunit IIA n=1 Tax=Klebsiella pneumoniae TaxID=573 RepID=UPI002FF22455
VNVVIILCARSGNEHITMIGELAEIFSDQQKLHRLLNADDSKAIQPLLTEGKQNEKSAYRVR